MISKSIIKEIIYDYPEINHIVETTEKPNLNSEKRSNSGLD
jgi:hypothetical protein